MGHVAGGGRSDIDAETIAQRKEEVEKMCAQFDESMQKVTDKTKEEVKNLKEKLKGDNAVQVDANAKKVY